MALFCPGMLEELKKKIDIVDVLSAYMQFERSQGALKALCPFHFEHTPSFVVQRKTMHYHCFGCGAHGDAIRFLMQHLRLSFREAVESLAERFGVEIRHVEEREAGPSLLPLKQTLKELHRFYHFCLLHTEAGQQALAYLYDRGIDLGFIRFFEMGYAPKDLKVFDAWVHDFRMDLKVLEEAGALKGRAPFFIDRITIPVKDTYGNVLGFTARRFRESAQGGPKYVNTKETPLFKKSQILFGIYESRKAIVKEKRALIVEGQIDAMRLIYEGFDTTLAAQGTAFGEQHVQQVATMGVETVYIAFDGDTAGHNATIKVGQLFLKQGIEVLVLVFEKGDDPDTLILRRGKQALQESLEKAVPYLHFLRDELVRGKDLTLPAVKSTAVKEIADFVNDWQDPVMRHEGKRRIAEMFDVPIELIRVEDKSSFVEKRNPQEENKEIPDQHQILEGDLIRWLLLAHEKARPIVEKNLQDTALLHPQMRRLFTLLMLHNGDLMDVLLEEDSGELQPFIDFILAKKIPIERATSLTIETVRKILERNWLLEREKIVKQMQANAHEDVLLEELVKKFDQLKQARPTVI